jgi:hypothetical protein
LVWALRTVLSSRRSGCAWRVAPCNTLYIAL